MHWCGTRCPNAGARLGQSVADMAVAQPIRCSYRRRCGQCLSMRALCLAKELCSFTLYVTSCIFNCHATMPHDTTFGTRQSQIAATSPFPVLFPSTLSMSSHAVRTNASGGIVPAACNDVNTLSARVMFQSFSPRHCTANGYERLVCADNWSDMACCSGVRPGSGSGAMGSEFGWKAVSRE